MARTTRVSVKVDSNIKKQAEDVLDQLGISVDTAMRIYLYQIALQRKIPFDISLPDTNKPISYVGISDKEFNILMNKAEESYKDGRCVEFKNFKEKITKEFGL
jgi:DNA-damage-inducible protein J